MADAEPRVAIETMRFSFSRGDFLVNGMLPTPAV